MEPYLQLHTRLHVVDRFQIHRQNAVVFRFYGLVPFLRRLVTNSQRVETGSSTSPWNCAGHSGTR